MAGPLVGKSWSKFYEANREAPPRPLLLRTLELMEAENLRPGQAIELGCGQGNDTAELLSRGWRVLAIDASEEGVELTRARGEALGMADSLETRCARFEELEGLPAAQLVYAAVSLPFCPPEHFDAFWQKIRAAVESTDGWISAQFFGPNDTWADNPNLNFHSRAEVEALFSGMDVRVFDERDEDGRAVSGPKHWHVFDVIAVAGS